jgi:hypothetical protein
MQTISLPLEVLIKVVNFALDDLVDHRYEEFGQTTDWRATSWQALDKLLDQDSRPHTPIVTADPSISEVNTGADEIQSEDIIKDEGGFSNNIIRSYTVETALRLYVIFVI